MVRSDLLKLSMTLVLLVATSFVSVASVAADDSGTIRLVKAAPASPTLGGTADNWYGQGRSPAIASDGAAASDWFERHPESIYSSSEAGAWWSYYGPPAYYGSSGDEAGAWWSYYGPPAYYGSGL